MLLLGWYIHAFFVLQGVTIRVVEFLGCAPEFDSIKPAPTFAVPLYAFDYTITVFPRLRRCHLSVQSSILVVPDYGANPVIYAHADGDAARPKLHYEYLLSPPNHV